ncbi:MAG: hypothetical protein ACSW8H_09455, partial [bacterium]
EKAFPKRRVRLNFGFHLPENFINGHTRLLSGFTNREIKRMITAYTFALCCRSLAGPKVTKLDASIRFVTF